MSLGGLAIAIGLMVDGSVVVVEHVFGTLSHAKANLGHDLSRSEKVQTVLNAVTDVATPGLFGVANIILVFLPLRTLEGMEGKMFAPLAYTIAIALAISLVLSLSLSPVLCTYLLKGGKEDETFLVRWIRKPYTRMLLWTTHHRWSMIIGTVVLFVASLCLFPFLGTSFIPECRRVRCHPTQTAYPTSRWKSRSRWSGKCSNR